MNKSIYFLCSGNSCRGQIAKGYAKKYLPNWKIESAGVRAEDLDPKAVKVMADDGIDISQQESKKIDDLFLNHANVVITLSGEARDKNVLPSTARWLHWPISDPTLTTGSESEETQAYRDVRDDIKQHIIELTNNIDKL
ncbi:arsenate reductase [Companilactobacillus heilongjiangensis]|jgi:arsenate reductase|uniref:Arsenate reductase n=1 Tax=Companilactobacillus heilongjiangensis TaxID=1074467 RepID=A0A0K2LEI1_9LACO|nr:arsenate reductase [Companilactobacillus heilongjiangensis]ALB29702.1 arsenate reductase [Companilactobacillus heilongjiangensis]